MDEQPINCIFTTLATNKRVSERCRIPAVKHLGKNKPQIKFLFQKVMSPSCLFLCLGGQSAPSEWLPLAATQTWDKKATTSSNEMPSVIQTNSCSVRKAINDHLWASSASAQSQGEQEQLCCTIPPSSFSHPSPLSQRNLKEISTQSWLQPVKYKGRCTASSADFLHRSSGAALPPFPFFQPGII